MELKFMIDKKSRDELIILTKKLLNDIKFYDNNFKNLKVSAEVMNLLKISNVNFCITPPNNNTKPHLKKIISNTEVLIGYLFAKYPDPRFGGIYRNCCHEDYIYDTCIHFDFPQILKDIRSGKNLYGRFQKYPQIATHISNLKCRSSMFKKGFYDPKNITINLLSYVGYKN
jgi:hypothetical protein